MRQEDINDLGRAPRVTGTRPSSPLPECPQCGERYCGDGVARCLECVFADVTDAPPHIDIHPEGSEIR